MEYNTALNVSCDFNGYLVCQMPKNTVEVELKIKTTRGKYTLNKDTCTRRERYCPWDSADRRAKIHTKKRRTSRKEMVSVDMVDSTNSETDIQNREGFAYAPKIYTNPNYAVTVPLTEFEDNELELVPKNFIGEYCGECAKRYNRCWCEKSDWDEELMEVETPKDPTTNNPSSDQNNIQKQPINITLVPIRQLPPGWVEHRRHVVKQSRVNECENLKEENPIEKLIIWGIRFITTKNFEEMKCSLKFLSRIF